VRVWGWGWGRVVMGITRVGNEGFNDAKAIIYNNIYLDKLS
jgi:hypothetical protein